MRVEDYRFELLTVNGLNLGRLEGVAPGGRLAGNRGAQIRWSGNLTYTGEIPRPDWYRYRIRPVATINGVDQPLGVYVVRPGETRHDPTGTTVSLDLYDKTLIPAEDATTDTLTILEGTPINAAVTGLLAAPVVAEADVTVTSSVMVWEPGTTKLRVINDLLATGGYKALWCDFTGAYRIEKWVPPASRPVAHQFTPGDTAIHTGTWVVKQDVKVPNKVICISQETADSPAMRTVATNENLDSPFSFQNQGMWIAATYTGIEACTQEILNQVAARYLAAAETSATITRTMALTPLDLGAVVTDQTGRREVIENIDIALTPGALMTVTSRQTR